MKNLHCNCVVNTIPITDIKTEENEISHFLFHKFFHDILFYFLLFIFWIANLNPFSLDESEIGLTSSEN